MKRVDSSKMPVRRVSVTIEDFTYSSGQIDQAMKSNEQNAKSVKERGRTVTAMIPHSNEGAAMLVGIRLSNMDLSLAQATEVLVSISGIDVTVTERDFTGVPYALVGPEAQRG